MLDYLLITLCMTGYGFFSAVQDRIKDGDLIWNLDWKQGNVRFPWEKDPWHLAKSMKQSCMYLAIAIALQPPWWAYPLIVILWLPATQGRSFSLNYHTLLKGTPDQTVWEWFKGTFNWKKYK